MTGHGLAQHSPAERDGRDWIERLVASHRSGWSLEQPFYVNNEIYSRDIERIFMRHWLYAGHVSRIPNPGDYFQCLIGGESIIVNRGKDGTVNALFNVCRHRGSRVCLQPEGNAKILVCPYHAWTYACDGSLLRANAMPDDLDTTRFGLHKCHVQVLEGLIFICMADDPPDIQHILGDFEPFLKPHGLGQTKIAAAIKWQVHANWKLVAENFMECYHCGPAHPEYCSVMAHALPETSGASKHVDNYAALSAEWESVTKRLGHFTGDISPTSDRLHRANRIPIKKGYLTQSRDGQPVAPLMGSFKQYDGGLTQCRIYPLNYMYASCDHAVVPRFTPLATTLTEVEMTWLVREGAVESVDYDVAELTWLWKVTTDQDKKIVDDNQAGVESRAYRPGMYSQVEDGLARFTSWYLKQIT